MSDWFFAHAPAARLRTVRLLVFGYAAVWLAVRSLYVLDTAGLPDRRFDPIGIWWWLDTPLFEGFVLVLLLVAFATAVAAALGRAESITAPAAAVATLAVITYTNSWGQVFHTENLLVLHLLVLGGATLLTPGPTEGWPLRLMSILTVVTYMLAGWAKLDLGGLDWLSGDVLRNQVAFDNLRKIVLGDVHSPVGGWFVGVEWFWLPIGTLTVIVELGAPLALLGGRIRTAWVAAAWAFHLGILVMMAILFPYPLTGIAFVSMFRAERLGRVARARLPINRTRRDPARRPARR